MTQLVAGGKYRSQATWQYLLEVCVMPSSGMNRAVQLCLRPSSVVVQHNISALTGLCSRGPALFMSLRAVIDMLLHRTFRLPLPALLGSALLLLLLLLNLQDFRYHSK